MPGTALFANFAKGAVFEFSFHGIQTIELTATILALRFSFMIQYGLSYA